MKKYTAWMLLAILGAVMSSSAESPGVPNGDPYTLDVCPVAGDLLGSMGDPVAYTHEGRNIKFCCSACQPRFEAEPAKYIQKMDALMIGDQKPHYPLTTDVVTGDPLPAEEKIVNVVHQNRLVRFGSAESAKTFAKAPGSYLAKLDEAVKSAQLAGYPTDKCVVSGQKLDSMGSPMQKVYANRLVQFCCANCPSKFEADPPKYLKLLQIPGSTNTSSAHTDHH